MACQRCLQHRKDLKTAVKSKDPVKVVGEVVSIGQTVMGKAVKAFGSASVKKRKE